jgi:hypothetical protein
MTERSPQAPSTAPSAGQGPEQDSVAFEDPAYRAAVVDLLGAITYGEISAFERLADDAKLAVELPDKLALATSSPCSSASRPWASIPSRRWRRS